jgi:hypothetical protein
MYFPFYHPGREHPDYKLLQESEQAQRDRLESQLPVGVIEFIEGTADIDTTAEMADLGMSAYADPDALDIFFVERTVGIVLQLGAHDPEEALVIPAGELVSLLAAVQVAGFTTGVEFERRKSEEGC